MKESIRNKIALLLLLVYVPLMCTLEFTHTHTWPSAGNSHSAIALVDAGSGPNVIGDSVCLACLFAAGHLIDAVASFSGIGFEHHIVLVSVPLIPLEFSLARSARAPPAYLS